MGFCTNLGREVGLGVGKSSGLFSGEDSVLVLAWWLTEHGPFGKPPASGPLFPHLSDGLSDKGVI